MLHRIETVTDFVMSCTCLSDSTYNNDTKSVMNERKIVKFLTFFLKKFLTVVFPATSNTIVFSTCLFLRFAFGRTRRECERPQLRSTPACYVQHALEQRLLWKKGAWEKQLLSLTCFRLRSCFTCHGPCTYQSTRTPSSKKMGGSETGFCLSLQELQL